MDNISDRYSSHDPGREQVWQDLADRIGESISVVDLDYFIRYIRSTSLQHRLVGSLLAQSLEVAERTEGPTMSVNDGRWPEAKAVAEVSEASHTGGVVGKANDTQVGGNHYKIPGGIDHWDYVEANKIPYLEARLIAYVARHERKAKLQDLEKAAHFLQKVVEIRYGRKLVWRIE